jgi:large subunit ribosomal protein L25
MAVKGVNVMDHHTVEAKVRETSGSTLTKLRNEGSIPAVVYGNGMKAMAIAVPEKAFVTDTGVHKGLVELTVDGNKLNAMVHDVQRHPVSKKVLHIDFYQVRLDQPIDTKVQLHVQGIEEVERRRGIVQQQLREVEVHALPHATPEYLTVDVTALEVGEHLSAGDIELPDGVTLRSDAAEVVASVLSAKRSTETETSEEETAEVVESAEE